MTTEEFEKKVTPESDTPPVEEAVAPASPHDDEEFLDADLEERLSQPFIQGDKGIDTAQLWIAAFLVAMAGLVIYTNALTIPFHDEDVRYIQKNLPVHRLSEVQDSLLSGAPGPLTMVSFAINWLFSPDAPLGFRVVNVALHVLNGMLVFFLCKRLSRSELPAAVPLCVGLLFVLHPLASESVNYVVGRASLLSTTFTLSAVILALRAVGSEQRRVARTAWALLFAFLAWASDTPGIVAPLLVLLALRFRVEQPGEQTGGIRAAFLGLLGAMLVFHWATNDLGQPGQTLLTQVLTASAGLARSLQLSLAPFGLTVDHGMVPLISLEDGGALASLIFAVVVAIAGVYMLMGRQLLGFSLTWFCLVMGCAYFFASSDVAYNERRSYLALAGLVMFVPWAMDMAGRYKDGFRNASLAVGGVALILAVGTFVRNWDWESNRTIWAAALSNNTDLVSAKKWLGKDYVLEGQAAMTQSRAAEQRGEMAAVRQAREGAAFAFRQAVDYLNEVVGFRPNDAEAHQDLAYAHRGLGENEEAIRALQNALRLDTQNQQITFDLAERYDAKAAASNDRYDLMKAIDYFRRAESLGPLSNAALVQYGLALGAANRWSDAIQRLRVAVADPVNKPAAPRLAQYERVGQVEAQLKQRLASTPPDQMESPQTMAIAAQLLLIQGKSLQSSYIFESLLESNPQDLQSWIGLGVARAHVQQVEAFIRDHGTAPTPADGGESPWIMLAEACTSEGRWSDAEAYLSSAPAQALGVGTPLIQLSAIATERNQTALATQLLNRATQQAPNDPAPWLKLCDNAIAAQSMDTARSFLAEAERRGAPAPEIESRRALVGTGPVAAPSETPEEAPAAQEFILQ